MTPEEEFEIASRFALEYETARSYAQRIVAILNEIEMSDEHAIVPYAEEGAIKLEGKYGYHVTIKDSFGNGWRVE